MKKYKTLVIDDERLAREELKSILANFSQIDIIGEARNGDEGIEMIADLEPDLIFLDVSMPGMTGFEMLKKLEHIPRVIFVTAYDEFALKAFEVNALDYILKPLDPNRLSEALDKLKSSDEDEFESDEPIEELNRKLGVNDKVFIKDGEKCYFVKLSEVRMFESDGNYVKVYFDKNRPLILRSLNSFEERLDVTHFFRANRKFIINLDWVVGIENWFNGGLQVELRTGDKVEVSRRQAIRFREIFTI
ncbi:MAG: LytTR family DNA-binding domain-containing protein [Crocinitomicaceae bacterium]|nr:LytTR family DNA-binding domain-containing protein [Crocinitomicaceae bacterium]